MAANISVVYDACVLYPAPLCDLLVQVATTGIFRAKWTELIHDEWTRNLLINRHVLAAAISANAKIIVTFNLKDFPDLILTKHGIVAQHPDVLLAISSSDTLSKSYKLLKRF
jgi:hypothetical protein